MTQKDKILELHLKGFKNTDIVEKLNIDLGNVGSTIYTLRKQNKIPPLITKRSKILKLALKGLTVSDISENLNMPIQNVYYHCYQLCLQGRL